MKKILKVSLISIFIFYITVGCGCTIKNNKNEVEVPKDDEKEIIIEDKTYEGLEFFNVGYTAGLIKTIVINNTGRTLGALTFSIKIRNNDGKVIADLKDEIREQIPTGTTKTIETKVVQNLENASSVEYSIISEQ